MKSATEWLDAIIDAVRANDKGSPEKLDAIVSQICVLQIKQLDQEILLKEARKKLGES